MKIVRICLVFAVSLVLQSAPPTAIAIGNAEASLFSARYEDAAELYTKLLQDDPSWGPGYYGLVRALIGAYRAREAYTVAEEGLRRAPESAEAQTAAGMAAYRGGDLARAESWFRKALKINPNYAGALRGLASIYRSVSKFKTARQLMVAAYHASPGDPQLITAWADTMEGADHIATLERALAIYDPECREARVLRSHIAADKAVGTRRLRRLTSPYQGYEIKMEHVVGGSGQDYGVALRVRFNDRYTMKLQLDTGASGISIAPKAAEKAGLTLGNAGVEARGIGDQKPQESFHFLASEVRIGDITFADFPVSVFSSAKSSDRDGLIGADVFEQFLVGIDFSRFQLSLEPHTQAALDTEDEPADATDPTPGFFRALRFGNHLTVPTSVNQGAPRLFLIDSGAGVNLIDADVARDFTKVHSDERTVLRGVQGRVKEVSRASRVSLAFAGFRQDNLDILAMSLESLDDSTGAGMAGIIGMPVLWQMKVTIDYRNGTVRFERRKR